MNRSELKRKAKAAGVSQDALDDAKGNRKFPEYKDAWIDLVLVALEARRARASEDEAKKQEVIAWITSSRGKMEDAALARLRQELDESPLPRLQAKAAELGLLDSFDGVEAPSWFEHEVFAALSDNPKVYLPIYALLYVSPVLTSWGSLME